ncbi:hypothetical protein [Streptomyces sp. NPDC058657]|uniref:hypothetical protein n=1 Tax=unclassified Streptomyces TaxID=2593676 RepID=UPI00365B2394
MTTNLDYDSAELSRLNSHDDAGDAVTNLPKLQGDARIDAPADPRKKTADPANLLTDQGGYTVHEGPRVDVPEHCAVCEAHIPGTEHWARGTGEPRKYCDKPECKRAGRNARDRQTYAKKTGKKVRLHGAAGNGGPKGWRDDLRALDGLMGPGALEEWRSDVQGRSGPSYRQRYVSPEERREKERAGLIKLVKENPELAARFFPNLLWSD